MPALRGTPKIHCARRTLSSRQSELIESPNLVYNKKPERLADHIDIFIDVFCDRLQLLNLSGQTLQRRASLSITE